MSRLEKDMEDLEKSVEELQKAERIYNEALERFKQVSRKLASKIVGGENYKRCNELRRKIEYTISDSNFPRYDEEAVRLVDYFKPFRYKRKVIRLQPLEYLTIGRTIAIIPNTKMYRESTAREIFQILLEHADVIIPNVRKNIREELAEFCRLGRELMAEMREELVAREGKFRVLSLEYSEQTERVRVFWQTYNKVTIYVDLTQILRSCKVYLINTDTNSRDVVDMSDTLCTPLKLGELYDTLAEMYEEAYKKLQAKKERCEEILKEMKKVVAPFVLSEL